VLCEAGRTCSGNLLAADVVDELCLTVAPKLAGGAIDRIAMGPHHEPRSLRLSAC